jgi:hypothetical protein
LRTESCCHSPGVSFSSKSSFVSSRKERDLRICLKPLLISDILSARERDCRDLKHHQKHYFHQPVPT